MYEIFQKLLEERGISTADVCKGTGINHSTMANWKKRRNKLSAKNAILIANYFGVSVDYLMGQTEPPESSKTDAVAKESGSPRGYYLDDEALEAAQFLARNPEYKIVFDAVRRARPEDLAFIKEMIDRTTS